MLGLFFATLTKGAASEIHVPSDYPSIQSAVDAAHSGDVIIVAPGRYTGRVTIRDKGLTITSTDPGNPAVVAQTILGAGNDEYQVYAIVFERKQAHSLPSAELSGFSFGRYGVVFSGMNGTISHCIFARGPSSIVADNGARCYVVLNTFCGTIGHIYANDSDVVLEGNTMVGMGSSDGIVLVYDGAAFISNSVISCSRVWRSIVTCMQSDLVLSQTIVAANTNEGYDVPVGIRADNAVIMGCTIVGNKRATGSSYGVAGWVSLFMCNTICRGNASPGGYEVLSGRCRIESCNIEGGRDQVSSNDLTWGPGNIDADPLFVDPGRWDGDTFIPGDYRLLPGSPCIDAGTNDVDNPGTTPIEVLPNTDLAGLPRVIDGDLDGAATVDIGAYEYLPGDVNYDGRVNILDLIAIRASLGQDPSSSPAARKADANADGRVNIEDLIMVRGRLGK